MEKYEKIRLVGRGAHGTVYLCQRKSDGQSVIVKQIPVDAMTTSERQSALGEVKILQMLSHPNIIGYFENFLEDNALCIVMQYAQGGTLADFLSERRGCLLEEDRILKIFAQILISLHHLHRRQILHRDLKCQNILLNKKRTVCKLSDFGISKTLLTGKSKASTVVGTPNYLSPELCDARGFNMKSDIWALGCVLYELCALKRAFQADTLPALIMKIMKGTYDPISDHYSDSLKKLLDHLLNLNPEKRPTTKELIASATLVGPVLNQIMEAGSLPGGPKIQKPLTPKTKHKLNTQKSSPQEKLSIHPHNISVDRVQLRHQIFSWGGHLGRIPKGIRAPTNQIKLVQAAAGPTRKMAVTTQGRVLVWTDTEDEENDEELFSSSLESYSSGGSRKPQYLRTGPSPITVAKIACGEHVTAFVTDRGMLLTCGLGADGCLGHGTTRDQIAPKIVKDLMCSSVVQVVCATTHTICFTSDNEVYGWGSCENGKLGKVTEEGKSEELPLLKPTRLKLPEGLKVHSVYATVDASAVVGMDGSVWVTGANNFNKLGIWHQEEQRPIERDASVTRDAQNSNFFIREFRKAVIFPSVDMLHPQPFGLGRFHSALISGCCVYIAGSPTGDRDVEFFVPRPVVLGTDKIHRSPQRVVCGDELTVAVSDDRKVWNIRPLARMTPVETTPPVALEAPIGKADAETEQPEGGVKAVKVSLEAELVEFENCESYREIVSLSTFRDTVLICIRSQ